MGEHVEAFFREVLALEGKNSDLVRQAVLVHLANHEKQVRKAEKTKRTRNQAAYAFEMECRARIVEAMRRYKGTLTAVHLKIALSVIDGPVRFPTKG